MNIFNQQNHKLRQNPENWNSPKTVWVFSFFNESGSDVLQVNSTIYRAETDNLMQTHSETRKRRNSRPFTL